MSDPRIIPADQARALREAAISGPWEYVETHYCPAQQREDEADASGLSTDHITYDCGCEEDATCEIQREVIGHPDGIISTNPPYFTDPEPGDMRLIAAAPDLAHTVEQQAARIERLREKLEALRDHARNARGQDSTADDLTHILEGDSHDS